jgi:putative hemolysin
VSGRIVDISSGPLQVRLAETAEDVDAARRCATASSTKGWAPSRCPRWRGDAAISTLRRALRPSAGARSQSRQRPDAVIGTYRLIRRPPRPGYGSFYSAAEFDIAAADCLPGEILELGRSCVEVPYRPRAVLQLLWSGIAAYVFHYRIALMFGCASLPGTDPDALATPLSYLHHHHLAPPALRARACRSVMSICGASTSTRSTRRGAGGLPPLIKGYLRVGGFVGDGAVIDEQFNTTDVCIVLKTDLVTDKYFSHYVRQAKDTWAA